MPRDRYHPRMRWIYRTAGLTVSAAILAFLGCGTSGDSAFIEGPGDGGDGGSSSGASSSGFGNIDASSGGLDDGAADDSGLQDGEACKTADSPANLQPIYLGFAFDVSGSMGQTDCPYWNHDPNVKWKPVVEATVAFFQDAASTNVNASMTLFPSKDQKCETASYTTPTVAMAALPSNAFATALSAYETEAGLPALYTNPMPIGGATWRGNTPTRQAVEGVTASLLPLKTQHPDAKIALVVVTDGLPAGCGDIAGVNTAVTAALAQGFPTYVIGVRDPAAPQPGAQAPWMEDGQRTWACKDGSGWRAGHSDKNTPRPTDPTLLDNLNGIAAAGSTGSAVLLDTGNPAATKAAFTAAVNTIRASSISCELKRPDPPVGQTFDPTKVNVRYDSGANRTSLAFDTECKATNAWRYKGGDTGVIELCPSTCTAVRADSKASLSVEFGCVRRDPGGVK
jgi:hypothetical protein